MTDCKSSTEKLSQQISPELLYDLEIVPVETVNSEVSGLFTLCVCVCVCCRGSRCGRLSGRSRTPPPSWSGSLRRPGECTAISSRRPSKTERSSCSSSLWAWPPSSHRWAANEKRVPVEPDWLLANHRHVYQYCSLCCGYENVRSRGRFPGWFRISKFPVKLVFQLWCHHSSDGG